MKLKLNILLILLCVFGATKAQQPKNMVKKFYPDPAVTINTPSFGMRGYVKYDEMMKYVEKTIERKNYISLQYIGESQKGKKIPAIIFRKTEHPKAKVMFTARIHGDEPASTEALLYLLDQLVNDSELSPLVDNLEIAILPMINIDGGDKLDRRSANGLDLNRDMSKLVTPENKALRSFFNQFAPDVELDIHEYNPLRADYIKYGSFGVSGYADVMFLYSENPNYQKPLKTFVQQTYLPILEKALDANDLTYHKYFTSNTQRGETYLNIGGGSPRSSSSAFGLANTVSLLIEIRGTNIGKSNFKRRVFTGYLVALNTLKMANEDSDKLKLAIKESTAAKTDIVVTQQRVEKQQDIQFIDIYKNKLIDIKMPVYDIADRENAIVRKRPVAYALLPSQAALADKLRELGISVEVLDKDETVNAERYVVTSKKEGSKKFEGFYEQIVKTNTKKKKFDLPKGSFIVSMDQRNSNLAAVMLEPEAENGFVRYCLLTVNKGEELPIYRLMNK